MLSSSAILRITPCLTYNLYIRHYLCKSVFLIINNVNFFHANEINNIFSDGASFSPSLFTFAPAAFFYLLLFGGMMSARRTHSRDTSLDEGGTRVWVKVWEGCAARIYVLSFIMRALFLS